jgi:hypothetical protein
MNTPIFTDCPTLNVKWFIHLLLITNKFMHAIAK